MRLRRAVSAIAFSAVAFAAGAAVAAGADIYIDVGDAPSGKPQVVFVLADSEADGYAPRDTFTVQVADDGACEVDYDATATIAEDRRGDPIYGPGSPRRFGPQLQFKILNAERLPTYFAREAVQALAAAGKIASDEEARPYFNCVGQTWALLISQPTPAE